MENYPFKLQVFFFLMDLTPAQLSWNSPSLHASDSYRSGVSYSPWFQRNFCFVLLFFFFLFFSRVIETRALLMLDKYFTMAPLA